MNNKVKKKFATNDKLSNHGYKDKIYTQYIVTVLLNINRRRCPVQRLTNFKPIQFPGDIVRFDEDGVASLLA